ELYSKILSAVTNVFSTDRAFLMLYDLDSGEFIPVGGRDATGALQKIDKKQIKSSIVKFVRENKESVLSIDDSFEMQRFQKLTNVPSVKTSTMCVPMLGKQQINGMIYLSLSSTTEKYTEDDLRLLTVIGHTAGMAVENSRLVQFNLKNERLVATGATAAGLSHYIKNILAGLDGSLNLLKMGIEDQDFKLTSEAATILNKNHKRLADLVLDLLNLASEQKPEFTIYDINLVISDVIELLESQLTEQGISISMDTTMKDSPLLVEIDAKGIHRVLLNLITNAEQAIMAKNTSTAHKGNIMVSSKLNTHNDYALITVSDDGVGLDNKEIQAMFDLFVTSKGSAGTGLGLAVSKRIINAHDGNVTATSEKSKGCTVAFSLPVSHNDTTTTTRTISKVKR
ncbi:MAG: GAF domain-containing protein, partial [Victivallales bacterium]|nr:GAF domain-containing protein [Victivallales bacterium]